MLKLTCSISRGTRRAVLIAITLFVSEVPHLWDFTGGRSAAIENNHCRELCQSIGYYDAQGMFEHISYLRNLLSVSLLLLLLKTLKFIAMLLPATSLLVQVLSKARNELFFFAISFGITVFAFSVTFWVQLGSQMQQFSSMQMSFITVVRALFGDFDLESIGERFSLLSFPVALFLLFLFTAVFVILSMFLAILGEAQGAVREAQAAAANKEEALKPGTPEYTKRKRQQNMQKLMSPAVIQIMVEMCFARVKRVHKLELKRHEAKYEHAIQRANRKTLQAQPADEEGGIKAGGKGLKKMLVRIDSLFGDEITAKQVEASSDSLEGAASPTVDEPASKGGSTTRGDEIEAAGNENAASAAASAAPASSAILFGRARGRR